jgi:hypothetical protein
VATPGLLARLVAAALLTAGVAAASGAPAPASAATSCTSAGAQRQVAAAVRAARARYGLERYGVAVHAALGTVAADRVLTDALRAGNLGAARGEAVRLVRGHQHISAIRVVRGRRLLVDTNVYPFDVAGAQATLRDRRGFLLGTLHVSIQDVLGFVRLVHKYGGSQVVVRGSQGEAKSSLPAALAARLPASGCAAVGGRTYAVRSFAEASFTGEPLTIWILTAP